MRQAVRKIIAVVGPTAVGKSVLAVRLACHFNGEIISADSRQVYRGLDVGAGKVAKQETRGVPHHLLDIADPKKQFSVAKYQKLGRKKLEEILSRGKLPIVVGGTGLYIDTLLNDTSLPNVPPNPRLREQLEKKSARELFALLKRLDPRRAKTIDPNNPRRLTRAIEIAKALGAVPNQRPTTSNRQQKTLWIGLSVPPSQLKEKIAIRLFARLRSANGQARISEQGMVREVRRLHKCGLSWRRMEELGLEYRYISRYLRGLLTKKEMVSKLQTEIWHYAKRQFTWFRRNKEITWYSPRETRKIEASVATFLRH